MFDFPTIPTMPHMERDPCYVMLIKYSYATQLLSLLIQNASHFEL